MGDSSAPGGAAPRQPAGAARQERQHPSQSAQQAGAAALNRFASQEDGEEARRRRQQARIKEQARLELEKEKQVEAEIAKVKEVYGEKEEEVVEAPAASGGVYFRCALVGEELCTKEEMRGRIREFLYSQLECGERGLTAVLIVHTCNSPRDRVTAAIDTLAKIVGNILANPAEPKFRKIRKCNKAYQGKVAGLEGTAEFMEGCGFVTRQVEGPEGALEECWVLPEEETDLEALGTMMETLRGAEPVLAELDRGTRVLPPGEKVDNRLPADFFTHSGEELRREQERRSEEVEREGMLRTQAMREREEARGRRKYRYCLIRVRFPDGWLVQVSRLARCPASSPLPRGPSGWGSPWPPCPPGWQTSWRRPSPTRWGSWWPPRGPPPHTSVTPPPAGGLGDGAAVPGGGRGHRPGGPG